MKYKEMIEKCLKAARLSYQYLKAHPENKPFVQGDFKTGGYQTSDEDDRLWAAAEMWQTTGEEEFLRDFEKRASKMNCQIDEDWDWEYISEHPSLTMDFVETYVSLPLDFSKMSKNESLTMDYVERHINEKWDWRGMSINPSLTLDFVERYPIPILVHMSFNKIHG